MPSASRFNYSRLFGRWKPLPQGDKLCFLPFEQTQLTITESSHYVFVIMLYTQLIVNLHLKK